ncbi:TetR/AcrR family transcriptional regulator C-terminal domain-containing protein [Amycolatopsis suaedae]|uniref:GntR family transcriptional regulator n=1 Tax=Amycolatopsis suaedae TaxID=2510978 RepID=A0A4Q7J0G9_9PSEU|nr:GntR family transcriptional regulator [Amycolatopsis suaedae]RZQ60840.1 GntR family transcriptional regulator [Amycolatopsis suaedae]
MSRTDPPYLRIVAEIRGRILAGELRPGDRVPSVRHLARRWGVATATANRAVGALRDEGLVEARVGSGTVVSARLGTARPGTGPGRAVDGGQVLRAAIAIADAEGLEAVSMRRVAAALGVGPMSLYRHVAGKDELVTRMVDEAFAGIDLPDDGPEGWRAKLELVARAQWRLCRRHVWLSKAVSFTRPLPAPNMMACTEWTLRALGGLGLPMATRVREALTLHSLVVTVALTMAAEVEAEHDTGVPLAGWFTAQRNRVDGQRFPLLAAIPEETVSDLDGLFEYGLARHLDGLAVLVRG